MKKILVIGGGAMGSAFTIPCIEKKNDVTITEPHSKRFIKDLSSKNKFHSALKIKLPRKLKFRKFSNELLYTFTFFLRKVIRPSEVCQFKSTSKPSGFATIAFLTKTLLLGIVKFALYTPLRRLLSDDLFS